MLGRAPLSATPICGARKVFVPTAPSPQENTGGWMPYRRYRRKEEIQEERERLGIIPAKVEKVIDLVVKRKRVDPEIAAEAAFRREISRLQMDYRGKYAEILRLEIEMMELKRRQRDDEEAILLLMH